ncbi:kinase-like domain-containing protein [Coemansia mojavensis]|nr:kinase-like domain-containing protein [Coemansia mojavensis]
MRQLVISGEFFDSVKYLYTAVVWKEGDAFFTGKAQRGFNLDAVEGAKINDKDIFPPVNSNVSTCANTTDLFIKIPCLLYHEEYPGDTKEDMLKEIEFLEKLSRFGTSPYVARYYGCQIRDGLAVGICLEKCPYKLVDAIDKRLIADIDGFIHKVKLGLEFIHSAGYIHDDIHDSNIMVMEDGNPKIIDFDSCKPIGVLRNGMKCGTPGWERENEIAEVENDLELLPKLAEYIRKEIAEQDVPQDS